MWLKVENPATSGLVLIDKSCGSLMEYRVVLEDELITNKRSVTIYLGDQRGHNAFMWRLLVGTSLDDSWWHFSVSWDGEAVFVYKNGAVLASNSWSGVISDFGCPYTLGRTEYDSNVPEFSYSVLVDSLAIFNTSIPMDQSNYRFSPDLNGRNLVAYFNFDEGYGTIVHSSIGPLSAQIVPLYDKSTKTSATSSWIASTAPIDDELSTIEDYPILIHLNASDPKGYAMSFTIETFPIHGALYFLHGSDDQIFTENRREVEIDDAFLEPRVLYVPNKDFHGSCFNFYQSFVCFRSSRALSSRCQAHPGSVSAIKSECGCFKGIGSCWASCRD
jgi:hypothetical protein